MGLGDRRYLFILLSMTDDRVFTCLECGEDVQGDVDEQTVADW